MSTSLWSRRLKAAVLAPAALALVLLAGCGESAKSSSSTTAPPDLPARGDNDARKSDSASAFMREAAQANMAEARTGKLAETHAASADAKNFGKHMVEDHSGNLQKVKELAARKGYTLPNDVSEKDANLYAQLEKLNGPDFDRAYMNAMLNGHREVVAKFEREAASATDSDVKAYAAETLPTLRQHLQMAEDINRRLANPAAASNEKGAQQPTEVSHPAQPGDRAGSNGNQNQPETSR